MRLAKSDSVHEARKEFADLAYEKYGQIVDRRQLEDLCSEHGYKWPSWLVTNHQYRAGRGKYFLPVGDFEKTEAPVEKSSVPLVNPSAKVPVTSEDNCSLQNYSPSEQSYIPSKDPLYVKFGEYDFIEQVLASRLFYPVFITGLSGNGKTFMTEQACANLKRDLFRVNITIETDEDDLLGGFRLIDGQTVWFDGPVVKAMLTGSVLLLDEIDLASTKVLCLQPVLEGKGVFLKKVNRFVKPAPGFTVVATANTKGKGSDDGRFIGTNILNEAFLERFPVTIEQEYPQPTVEKRILKKVFSTHNIDDTDYIELLVRWADSIRGTFADGACNEIISTRRLVHIANAYAIVRDRERAISLCINRFDADTKEAFLELWGALVAPEEEAQEEPVHYESPVQDDAIPF